MVSNEHDSQILNVNLLIAKLSAVNTIASLNFLFNIMSVISKKHLYNYISVFINRIFCTASFFQRMNGELNVDIRFRST